MSDKDWREWAYLRKENWPEAIPGMGPKREHGPYPWSEKSHEDPRDVDDYPHHHPDAGSIGDTFLGDVCPYCGVPLSWRDVVVTIEGSKGELSKVSPPSDPVPCYHPDCYRQREGENNAEIDDYT